LKEVNAISQIGSTPNVEAPRKLIREELLKRKQEVKRLRAISQVKHLLSKQEQLKSEQERDMQKTAASYQECKDEITAVQNQISQLERSIQVIGSRKEVLEELLAENAATLVEKRRALHELKDATGTSRGNHES
jgi:chromosome segregation ATPase